MKKLQDFINELESGRLGHAMYTDSIVGLLKPIIEDLKKYDKVYQIEFDNYDEHTNHGVFHDKKLAESECKRLEDVHKQELIDMFARKLNPDPQGEYDNRVKEDGTYYKVIEYEVDKVI